MSNQGIGTKLSNFMREALANRRTTRRFQVALQLRFSIVHQSKGLVVQKSRAVSACTVDLSKNGLSIKTNNMTVDGLHVSISPDSTLHKLLEIEMSLPDKKIVLKATPMRYRKLDDGMNFVVGVKITAMPPEDRKAYDAYLKSFG